MNAGVHCNHRHLIPLRIAGSFSRNNTLLHVLSPKAAESLKTTLPQGRGWKKNTNCVIQPDAAASRPRSISALSSASDTWVMAPATYTPAAAVSCTCMCMCRCCDRATKVCGGSVSQTTECKFINLICIQFSCKLSWCSSSPSDSVAV